MSTASYSLLEDGSIRVRSQERAIIILRINRQAALKIVPLSRSDDCVVMLDWMKSGAEKLNSNLVRIAPDGSIRRVAELPSGDLEDCYTDVTNVRGPLAAFAFSGYDCILHEGTGSIMKAIFVK